MIDFALKIFNTEVTNLTLEILENTDAKTQIFILIRHNVHTYEKDTFEDTSISGLWTKKYYIQKQFIIFEQIWHTYQLLHNTTNIIIKTRPIYNKSK